MNLSIRHQPNVALALERRGAEAARQLALKAEFTTRVQARRVRPFNRVARKSADVRMTVAL